ncbi:spore germination protein GerPE [Microbacteriaceae bacterium 4G12]
MFRRFSVVNEASVLSLGLSSIFQIGDTNTLIIKNRSLTAQRETTDFLGGETPLESYPIFFDTEITIPTRRTNVRMHTINENPFIYVNHVVINTMLNAGVLHIGSVDDVFANSRLHQVREYVTETPFGETPSEQRTI